MFNGLRTGEYKFLDFSPSQSCQVVFIFEWCSKQRWNKSKTGHQHRLRWKSYQNKSNILATWIHESVHFQTEPSVVIAFKKEEFPSNIQRTMKTSASQWCFMWHIPRGEISYIRIQCSLCCLCLQNTSIWNQRVSFLLPYEFCMLTVGVVFFKLRKPSRHVIVPPKFVDPACYAWVFFCLFKKTMGRMQPVQLHIL